MTYSEWTPADAAGQIKVPTPSDDKYSRGVLGIVTGSTDYPGAAVIGVEAALRTGVGMARYLGPEVPTRLALERRPEIVTRPGRVQAWLLGSGIAAGTRDDATVSRLTTAITQGLPTVLDAGALELLGSAAGPTVITPHHGELARMLGIDRSEIALDPAAWAARAAADLGVTVLLKGFRTHIADPYGTRLLVTSATSWTATAGTGDALGGILGSLLATHSAEIAATRGALAPLAATACVLHSLAAERASGGGPFAVLDLAAELSGVVARLLAAPRA